MNCKYFSDNNSKIYFNLYCYPTQKHHNFPTFYLEFNNKVKIKLKP